MYSIYYLLVYALNIQYLYFGPQIINRNLLANNIRIRENKCIMNLNEHNKTFEENYNSSFNYVNSIDFDENQNLWIVDIDTDKYIEDEQEKLNENVINKQLEPEDKFPSFYEFIEQRKIKKEIMSEYRKRFIEGDNTETEKLRNNEIDKLRNRTLVSKQELEMIQNISMKSLYDFLEKKDNEALNKLDKSEISNRNRNKNKPEIGLEPQSNNLKLLTSLGSIEWAKNWIYDMVHYNSGGYPRFMYYDMFCMKDFARVNDTDLYFYIGYFPSDVNLNNGPYYIGAFELVPKDRAIHTHLIIQNPNYWIDTNEKDDKIINFKKELEKMTMDAGVFFKFSKLQNTTNQRYYYSWLYEED